jgi:hypothetical protein
VNVATATRSNAKKKSSSSSKSSASSSSSAPARQKTAREKFADWPQKGYDGPQPWDHKANGVDAGELEPGERDRVSAVDPRPGLAIIASGSAGEPVRELGQRLADLGYDNSVVHGDNPFSVADDSVIGAVERFRSDYGVEEAPSEALGGDTEEGRRRRAAHVGPYTQEAIVRASDRAREQIAKDAARGA